MNGILFFDTETTGLADFGLPEVHPAQPYLVQLAAILGNENGDVVSAFNVLITRPLDFEIPIGATQVHGITSADCAAYGVPLQTALGMFNAMAMRAQTVVAHNFEFDVRIVRSEVARMNFALEQAKKPVGRDMLDSKRVGALKRFCTMRESVDVLRLKSFHSSSQYKFPSLSELHQYYFGKPPEKSHDALADVEACMRCYYELTKPRTLDFAHGANEGAAVEEMDERARAAQATPFVQGLEKHVGAEFRSNEDNERAKPKPRTSRAQPKEDDNHKWI